MAGLRDAHQAVRDEVVGLERERKTKETSLRVYNDTMQKKRERIREIDSEVQQINQQLASVLGEYVSGDYAQQ